MQPRESRRIVYRDPVGLAPQLIFAAVRFLVWKLEHGDRSVLFAQRLQPKKRISPPLKQGNPEPRAIRKQQLP
jgi:hypothetical protein